MCDWGLNRFRKLSSTESFVFGTVLVPFIIIVIAMLGFVFNMTISKLYFPVALIFSCLCTGLVSESHGVRNALLVGIAYLVAMLVSSFQMILPAGDAQSCHYPAMTLLANGWNPLRVSEYADLSQMCPGANIWHLAFTPRGAWIYGASLYKIFGYREIADSLNYVLVFSAIWMLHRFVAKIGVKSLFLSLILSALMVLNPVIVCWWFTGCFDASILSCFIIAAVCLNDFAVTGSRRLLPIAICTLALMSGIKATGIAYMILLVLGYGIYSLRKTTYEVPILVFLLTFVFVIVMNLSPYVTSSIHHGGPFYPSHSFDKTEELPGDKLTFDFSNINDDAREMGYWGRFCYAWLSQDAVKFYYRKRLGRNTFDPVTQVDVQGYGRLFGAFVIVALMLWPFVRKSEVNALAVLLLCTVLIQPTYYSGYARYANQFYMFPWLILIAVGCRLRERNSKLGSGVLLLPLLMPLVLLPKHLHRWPTFWMVNFQSLKLAQSIQTAKQPKNIECFVVTAYIRDWLRDCGIPYIPLKTDEPQQKDMRHAGLYGEFISVWSDCVLPVWCTDKGLILSWNNNAKTFQFPDKSLYYPAIKNFFRNEVFHFPEYLFEVVAFRLEQILKNNK